MFGGFGWFWWVLEGFSGLGGVWWVWMVLVGFGSFLVN